MVPVVPLVPMVPVVPLVPMALEDSEYIVVIASAYMYELVHLHLCKDSQNHCQVLLSCDFFFLFIDRLLHLLCQQHVPLARMFEKFDKLFVPSGSFFC